MVMSHLHILCVFLQEEDTFKDKNPGVSSCACKLTSISMYHDDCVGLRIEPGQAIY